MSLIIPEETAHGWNESRRMLFVRWPVLPVIDRQVYLNFNSCKYINYILCIPAFSVNTDRQRRERERKTTNAWKWFKKKKKKPSRTMTFFYLNGFVIEKERVNTHVCTSANALILSLRLNENFDEVNVNICRQNTFEAEWFISGKQRSIFIDDDEKVFNCKAACFLSLSLAVLPRSCKAISPVLTDHIKSYLSMICQCGFPLSRVGVVSMEKANETFLDWILSIYILMMLLFTSKKLRARVSFLSFSLSPLTIILFFWQWDKYAFFSLSLSPSR